MAVCGRSAKNLTQEKPFASSKQSMRRQLGQALHSTTDLKGGRVHPLPFVWSRIRQKPRAQDDTEGGMGNAADLAPSQAGLNSSPESVPAVADLDEGLGT